MCTRRERARMLLRAGGGGLPEAHPGRLLPYGHEWHCAAASMGCCAGQPSDELMGAGRQVHQGMQRGHPVDLCSCAWHPTGGPT